jgi:hypothetical protein
MPLYHKDVALPQGDVPVGYLTSGFFITSGVTQAVIPAVPLSGATDTTTFSIFYVPKSGTYSLTYYLSSYTSGSVQEAIFAYRPDLLGVGDTILNQNWASPSVSRRTIDNLVFARGYYWISLRASNGGIATNYTNSTAGSLSTGSQDLYFNMNNKRLNTAVFQNAGGSRVFQLWDNSITPTPAVILYNGNLADYTPYQNVTNKYMFSNNTLVGHVRIKLRRTA